ncbi:hypothetical protein Gohar_022106 [Gossypium harknessii]|uniref:Uncharacterized protein n=1 Tax=Gossypium harknessii TaxID=34285 RepID=A0A7J9I5L7_9ROSI|nr:hypothetical protein [Gossypium harknessii]
MVKVVSNDLNKPPDHARSLFEEDVHRAMAIELSLDSFWSLDVKANNSEGLTAGEIIAKGGYDAGYNSNLPIMFKPTGRCSAIDEGDHGISISNTTLPLVVNKHDESFLGLGSRQFGTTVMNPL